ncbi:MAG: glycosyltransferase family 2 protein [Chitinophagaceae bacterium]
MKNRPTTSLIIAVYNWPEALELCLNSVLAQSEFPTELIIADDGSKPLIGELIEKYKARLSIPLKHIWQPDEGFKLAQIRNKAVAASACDYIIQVDGDLILHPFFIKDHVAVAEQGHFVGGSRVIVSESLSAKLLSEKKINVSPFQKGISNKFNGLYLPSLNRQLIPVVRLNGKENIRGCNMAYWRNDFISVNGYNEDFQGWGREDTDLVLRFYTFGLNRTFFKFRGIVYHIYHQEADRSRLTQNDALLEKTKSAGYYCKNGIDKYLHSFEEMRFKKI